MFEPPEKEALENRDGWPDNVTPLPSAKKLIEEAQKREFDDLVAEILAARVRELRENAPSRPTSEELTERLMLMRAVSGDQLGAKLRLFAIELSKEAEFGQSPDLRLIPFFAAIQRDCLVLLNAKLPDAF